MTDNPNDDEAATGFIIAHKGSGLFQAYGHYDGFTNDPTNAAVYASREAANAEIESFPSEVAEDFIALSIVPDRRRQ